jgi:hypothetical protein
MMFDFPEPFGPEITVKCSKKGMVVFRPKDLKLSISIWVICKAGPAVCRSGSFGRALHFLDLESSSSTA